MEQAGQNYFVMWILYHLHNLADMLECYVWSLQKLDTLFLVKIASFNIYIILGLSLRLHKHSLVESCTIISVGPS